VEKYVHFDQFYRSITQINDYKYSIIPIFVEMKTSLYKNKIEPEYQMDRRNINEFLSIGSEIVANVKLGNYEYIKQNQDMKKIMDKLEPKKLTKKKLNNKKNATKEKDINNTNEVDGYHYNNNNNNQNILPLINNSRTLNKKISNIRKDSEENNNSKRHPMRNISLQVEGNKVNLNKITNLEAQPGKIRIKDMYKDSINLKTDGTIGIINLF
jgi:hypothetical protein